MITGKAALAGVMGWPVAHSLSPLLHNRWLAEADVDGAYVPLPVAPEHLADAFRTLPKLGFKGWNLTVPHKETALALVHELDETAKAIGAVNTVVVRDDLSLLGRNTDAHGFLANLREKTDAAFTPNHAVVLGAGGAARAVVYALKQAGTQEIILVNRTEARAQALALAMGVAAAAWEMLETHLPRTDLLVNTTTLGMEGQPPLTLPLAALKPNAAVADIVYKPLMTELLVQAKANDHPVVTGLGMLIHQAVPGFEAWFGQAPRVAPEVETWLAAAW